MPIAPAAVQSAHAPDLGPATATNSHHFHPLVIELLQLLALPGRPGRHAKGMHPRLPAWSVGTSVNLARLVVEMVAGMRDFVQQRLFEKIRFLIHLQADADRLTIL